MDLIVCCRIIRLPFLCWISLTTDSVIFLKILDSLSSELHRQGIGATKNSAKVIDPKHEDIFWEKSPWLFYPQGCSVYRFFYVGFNFVLRDV